MFPEKELFEVRFLKNTKTLLFFLSISSFLFLHLSFYLDFQDCFLAVNKKNM